MKITTCLSCGSVLNEEADNSPALRYSYELGPCCKQPIVLEEIEESTLSRENIRESLTKPGAHAEY